MAENFICVTQQILLLAAIILVGFALSKANLISAEGENAISALAMYVATPAVVISALQRPFEAILWMGLKQTALIVILTFAVMVTVTKLTIRHADIGYRSVMRFAAIFANVGFMCLPLVKALYGKTGVFYCSVVVALFNIETWTYGYALMSSVGGGKLPLKKAFLNPGVLSTLVGALLFLTSTSLPAAVDAVVDAFSPLNTPLGMIVIGCRMAHSDPRIVLKSAAVWISTIERPVVFPLLLVLALHLTGIRGVVAMVAMITTCAPAASVTTMMAVFCRHDEAAGSQRCFAANGAFRFDYAPAHYTGTETVDVEKQNNGVECFDLPVLYEYKRRRQPILPAAPLTGSFDPILTMRGFTERGGL